MANERLRSCIAEAGLTVTEVAEHVGVDPKTVERWISTGRIPHRSNRWCAASLLQSDEAYLWPQTLTRSAAATSVEPSASHSIPQGGRCLRISGLVYWRQPKPVSTS
ncbi:MAG: helix-turn-helix domain-containing protein [Egibacteraceae bacterium]